MVISFFLNLVNLLISIHMDQNCLINWWMKWSLVLLLVI